MGAFRAFVITFVVFLAAALALASIEPDEEPAESLASPLDVGGGNATTGGNATNVTGTQAEGGAGDEGGPAVNGSGAST